MGRRVIWIVLDSVGAGEASDSAAFGDCGADTLGHIIERYPDIKIPNMRRLGLGNIDGVSFGDMREEETTGCYGKCSELSNGKDTTTGHWEMIGIYTKVPFPTYPDGFPDYIIDEFIKRTGCKGIYGNKVASGVPIIAEYGEEHMETGYPIVYTSADSVYQIAASEEKVGLDNLYNMCRVARELLTGENAVGRVIARPFIRKPDGSFERTANRRDYALKPDDDNVLSHLQKSGVHVYAVGKISDIFDNVGIDESVHTISNKDGMEKTKDYFDKIDDGLIFTNLVDFDMKYGHRRDVSGYKNALEKFDEWLGLFVDCMKDDDIIIINADHGCDPTYKGTDHTREYIPLRLYGKCIKSGYNLGIRKTFADIGKTVEEYLLGEEYSDTDTIGKSFLGDIII